MTAELDLSLVPAARRAPAAASRRRRTRPRSPTGLHLVVVPRPGVPLIELRLRVPFAAPTTAAPACTPRARRSSPARSCSGTAHPRPDRHRRAAAEQGAELSVSADPDRLLFSTTLLPGGLSPVSGVLAELLTGAAYPADRVEGERERVAERIGIARSQPGVIARTALAARRYGSHPYAIQLPDTDLVTEVRRRRRCGRLHGERILPAGSTLVLVGDLDPRAATDAVAGRAGGMVGDRAGRRHPAGARAEPRRASSWSTGPVPCSPTSGSAVRRPAAPTPICAALRLANMVFGGYFSSRLVENIRERRGYTYSPRSAVDHPAAGSSFLVEADVATEVTGPALLETWYELGRMALTPVTEAELDGARRYVLGSMALSTATHAGLASTLSALIGAGLPADWLADHQRALATVTVEEVQERPARYLAAAALTAVVVGDADRVAGPLRALGAGRRRRTAPQ